MPFASFLCLKDLNPFGGLFPADPTQPIFIQLIKNARAGKQRAPHLFRFLFWKYFLLVKKFAPKIVFSEEIFKKF
jgi:hypothetical protein